MCRIPMPSQSRNYRGSREIKRRSAKSQINYQNLPFLKREDYEKSKIPGRGHRFTKSKKRRFLEKFSQCGSKSQAATEVGVSTSTVSYHLDNDGVFEQQYRDAKLFYDESVVEGEIIRRGVEGVDEDIFATYKGEATIIGTKTIYSDKMLELYAKANIPKYKDKSSIVDVNTSGVLIVNQPSQSDEDWERKHGD